MNDYKAKLTEEIEQVLEIPDCDLTVVQLLKLQIRLLADIREKLDLINIQSKWGSKI